MKRTYAILALLALTACVSETTEEPDPKQQDVKVHVEQPKAKETFLGTNLASK